MDAFHSRYIGNRIVDVWLPRGYTTSKKFDVVYMHDGQMLFDSAMTWNRQEWNVDEVLESLFSRGRVRDCIIVGIWNGGAHRHRELMPQKPFESLSAAQRDAILSSERNGSTSVFTGPVCSDEYLRFIVQELKPHIDSLFSTNPERDHTFAMGSSMGGMISLYALCEYPDVFGAAACLSTHWTGIFTTEGNPIPGAMLQYLRTHLPSPDHHRIYFDYGTETLDTLYEPFQQQVDSILKSKGYSFANWMTRKFVGADHSERSWSKRLSIPFSFLISHISPPVQRSFGAEIFERLPFGSIRPAGWIKRQMQNDMAGFVGNLDRLVPALMTDPIYGEGRLRKDTPLKDLGNLKDGDTGGDEQYKWWNSETQSNWRDGYLRHAVLLDDTAAQMKVDEYIDRILATQDEDGYLGIYDRELRYHFTSENGELWSKATLYRGLLAYYEHTGDVRVWDAVVRAVANVMQNYPVNASQPFDVGKNGTGGVAHGLTFTDVLDRMYQLTGDRSYREYALFLYRNYSQHFSSEQDAQLDNILDKRYTLQCHGVHTYEHLRPLIVAAATSGDRQLQHALNVFLERIQRATTIAGGPVGDEWIGGRSADATRTGYEYCSLQELLDSYTVLLRYRGDPAIADMIETIFYNAAQGSRHPDHSSIAYLKTDNSYEMMGTRNGEREPGRNQTRYKYSPVHQDVAVCCAPNAGRITPYFLQSSWLKEGDTTLVAALLAPNIVETTIRNVCVRIENETNYPFGNRCSFHITSDPGASFVLKIRKPVWARRVETAEPFHEVGGFIVIDRPFNTDDRVDLAFRADVLVKTDANRESYFTYGALVYARPIEAEEHTGRRYAQGFEDLTYSSKDSVRYGFTRDHRARYEDGKLTVRLKNLRTGRVENVELLPLARTVLRQASFR